MLLVLLNCLTESTFPSPSSSEFNLLLKKKKILQILWGRGGGGGGGGGETQVEGDSSWGGGGEIPGPPPLSIKPWIYSPSSFPSWNE